MYINNMMSMTATQYLSKLILSLHKKRLFIRMCVTFLESNMYIGAIKFKAKEYQQLLKRHAGISDWEAKSILKYTNVFRIPQSQIVENCNICKNLGVSLYGIGHNIEFLHMNQQELENRILILKELGAKYINTAMIESLATNVPMNVFKTYTGIRDHVNVAEILFSHLHKPPLEVPPLNRLSEQLTVERYRAKCLAHYLRWRFELSDVNERFLMMRAVKLHNKTFASLKYSFDVLHNDGKMPLRTIWNYQCLAKSSGSDLKRILHDYHNICGVTIVHLLRISPKLHEMKYKNVTAIKRCLEQHNITRNQLLNAPNILLLDGDYFIESWERLLGTPRLRILLKHTHILRVFTLPDNFNYRIDYLEHLSISDITVHILRQTASNFDRSIKCRIQYKRAEEIYRILGEHLDLTVNCTEKILSKHPLWRQVTLLNINSTINYLKAHFSSADIEKNLQIVLYPKDRVKNILEDLIYKNGLMNESDRYSPSQILALCVYEMEKVFHFTGDGIWENSYRTSLSNPTEKYVNKRHDLNWKRDKYPFIKRKALSIV